MRNIAIFTHNDDAEAVKIATRGRLNATKDTHARIENVAFVAFGLPCASSDSGHAALAAAEAVSTRRGDADGSSISLEHSEIF